MKKTAVITGASRGIGFGIAMQLAKDGFRVVLAASSPSENHGEKFRKLEEIEAEYDYIQTDVSRQEDREAFVEAVCERYGRIDVWVNNAGVAPKVRADLLDMTEESFDRLIAINTKSVMFLSQAVSKRMLKQEPIDGMRGILVNISSMSAVVSSVSRGEYCVSKAGVSMLTRLYADRLAGEQIYVYEIRPGIIATDMTAAVKGKYDALFAEGICPIGRWGTPEDIGNAVSVLCSGKLRYTTGQVIDVDGGFQIQRL
ncbi:MAG: 3-ketoacyl-ACP reductase [Eubacteriales bacterium]|nr:3-ketoacyl-ACP reductase [Eubacteriales bacterium]